MIKIPATDDKIRPTEVETSKSELKLLFKCTNENNSYDYITFGMKEGNALDIAIGAIACTSNDGIYPKILFDSLDQTINYTEQISK